MDKQAAIDRILETENLTVALVDEDARWLLDWGINYVPALIDNLDDEAAGVKVNELMAIMRKLNQVVADREAAAAEDLAQAITDLADIYARAFGSARPLSPEETSKLAVDLSTLPPRQALQALIETIQPAEGS